MLTSSSVVCVERPKDTFGARLKAARERKGISQPALAEMVKVSPMMISRYERDQVRDPNTSIVMKICESLGLKSPEDLGFTSGRDRAGARLRSVAAGPTSAREAVADANHYLRYLFKRAGLSSEEEQLEAATRLDEGFPQFEAVTPALVDLWLEGYARGRTGPRSTTSRKRGRSGQ